MKKLQSFIAILMLILIILSVDNVSAAIAATQEGSKSNEEIIDDQVFPHYQVIDVNIEIDEEVYAEMINNAMDEEYVLADITYNGYTFNNIAIRPKGNSSLRDVANAGGDRFSFKVDFDKYIDGQNMFGITKLNLNNLFSDDTLMAEYLGYEMLQDMGAVASDTTYTSLSINGEYFGLYIAVEAVDERFLDENFGNFDGELYKPDMGIGADLAYISDDPDDYSGISPQDEDMTTDEDFVELVKTIDEIIKNGGESEEYNLSNILNVDSFLKYLAFSSATIHLDTYQSGMYHNYYLYFNTDTEKFEWISWDLNMIFNNYPGSGLTDAEATQFLIDEPVTGELSKYPLVQAVLTNEEYVDTYHVYLEEFVDNYLSEEKFTESVIETFAMIEAYASVDPSAFFTTDQAKISIFEEDAESNTISLLQFIALRVENISQQLNGQTSSTNNGEGNIGTGGKGGNMQGNNGQRPEGDGQRPEGGPPGMNIQEGEQPEMMPEGEPEEMIQEGNQQENNRPERAEMGNAAGMPGNDVVQEDSSFDIMDMAAVALSLGMISIFTIYLAARKY